ncbi:MAG: ferrous iron transport protein A [Ruminococcaceae bacterium]|nr:ferrous iron transport protein A [Oscillospiraceae bacterium]
MKRKNRLDELCVGECGKIYGLTCDGSMRRRFLDIGFAPGTAVVCLGRSPLGDPSLYLVRGCKIAIRNRDAHGIEIREKGD